MSGFRSNSGHVLGATTVSSATVLPAVTGHHEIALYVAVTAGTCIVLVMISKVAKRLVLWRQR